MSHERFRAVLIAVALAASAAVVAFLPAGLPPAFGVPLGAAAWLSRVVDAFFLPLAAAAVCLIFRRLANAGPARASVDRFRGTFELVLDASVGLVIALHATLLATLLVGVKPSLGLVPPLAVGIVLVVIGNALPRVRPNDVIGVTTAWAKRSERAWARTHRVAGYLVVALGLAVIVSTFLVRDHLGSLVGIGVGATALLLALVSLLSSRKEGPHAAP